MAKTQTKTPVKTLRELKKGNPWAKATEEWKKWLEEGKPLRWMIDKLPRDWPQEAKAHDGFVLDEDRDFIFSTRRSKAKNKRIHVELPPQPFIGDPTAPVWILSNNPSYSPVDLYDMLGEDRGKVIGALQEEQRKKNKKKEKTKELKISEDDFQLANKLGERQTALMDALDLQKPQAFYPLNEKVFKTLKGKSNGRGLDGTYQWWKRKLGKFCDEHGLNPHNDIFNIEFFPYHSEDFPVSPGAAKNTAHFEYIVKLLEWVMAPENDKILIVRSRRLWHLLLDSYEDKSPGHDRVFEVYNSWNFSITEGNLVFYFKDQEGSAFARLTKLLEKLKKK